MTVKVDAGPGTRYSAPFYLRRMRYPCCLVAGWKSCVGSIHRPSSATAGPLRDRISLCIFNVERRTFARPPQHTTCEAR